ncbi:hypothetical protein CPPEL_03005 [Corynebacterium pseudopelargi]|uniref:Uncharacterized protein n=1 Tax=Corynebacterium pseudopelargi TaxID=2080757 RepID=A0A3G6ISW2_9CORY|nr:hypothetical protein CPPEL_03005 [Corynebacterium pseudopelargi]
MTLHSRFLRLKEPPRIIFQFPYCSACCINLTDLGEVWECPSCGHQWGEEAEPLEVGVMRHPDTELTRNPVQHLDDIAKPGTTRRKNLIKKLNRSQP